MEKKDGAKVTHTTIDGQKAKIVTVDNQVAVYFARTSPRKDNPNRLELTIDVQPPARQEDAIAVIRSIVFHPDAER
jgi:hypothetical protein